MFIRRVCAAAILGLAMSASLVGSSYAGSNAWYPERRLRTGNAYEAAISSAAT